MNKVDSVDKARFDDPRGKFCGRCGDLNLFADDCGWFYANHMNSLHHKGYNCPVCEKCWHELGCSTCER